MAEAREYPYMETLPLQLIDKNELNPNEQDERTFNALCESLQEEGWVEPMATVVSKPDGRYTIVSGHHRTDAALALGMIDGPCLILDPDVFDADRQNWTMVKVNNIRGKLSKTKFTRLYNEMAREYSSEELQTRMGFVDEDAFKAVYEETRKGLSPELQKRLDEQKDEIKTIDDLSLVLNRLFREHGEELQSNMMVFSFLGKDVLWIRADEELWNLVSGVASQTLKERGDMAAATLRIIKAGLGALAQEENAA